MVRCKTCSRTQKVIDRNNNNHHWDHQQCLTCHYYGMRPDKLGQKTGRFGKSKIKGNTTIDGIKQRKTEKHRVVITEKNIELYCRLSNIIRNKPCANKKQVIARQNVIFSAAILP